MKTFEGAVAIVTGGASGIGRALCEEMGRAGASVVIADLDEAGAAVVARALSSEGHRATAARVDVTRHEEVRELVRDTVAREGRLDYMVNNAGVGLFAEARDASLEQWRRVIDVDLWGVIHGVSAAYPVMVAQRSGHILNVASAYGLYAPPFGGTAYAAAKHGVVGLTLALRAEAAALGVKVSAACPGFTRTRFFEAAEKVRWDSDPRSTHAWESWMLDATTCSRAILRGLARNRPVIPVGRLTNVLWRFSRISPGLFDVANTRMAGRLRTRRRTS